MPFGRLDIIEDLTFQRRWWRIQRAGWATMAVLVVAAFIGLFGDGIIGQRRATFASGRIVANFDPVARRSATDSLEFEIQEIRDAAISLQIPRSFLQHVVIRNVEPRPIASHSDRRSVTHVFAPPLSGGHAWIGIDLEYVQAGVHRGKFVLDGEECRITQVVLP
jgi:hypothetical protein